MIAIEHQAPSSDPGTPELRRKHPAVEVPTEDAGIMAAQVLEECLLDSLFRRGRLAYRGEPQDKAQRRYDAGLWLRSLYHRSGMERRVTMAYSVFGQAGGPEELTEAEAWNRRAYIETLRDLPGHAALLAEVCCRDARPRAFHCDLRAALDRLADFRGM